MNEGTKIDNRRMFVGPDKETEYFVADPSADDVRGADWTYSKVYTKCLIEGITTSSEMYSILMRRGIIGPEFEQRQRELTELLSDKITQLETVKSIDEKRLLALEVSSAREDLFQWNQRLNGPMSNTCEQIADDSRLEYITSRIIQKKDGTKVWDSYDTYLVEKNQSLSVRSRYEVMLFLQGLSSNFLENTPEAVAMKEVEIDIFNKTMEIIKATEAVKVEEIMDDKDVEEKAEIETESKSVKKISKKKK
jgi:hypothetical protein